ncbi:MAG: trimethylamine methyltransferase family protein [Pseudomonadota bacterium]
MSQANQQRRGGRKARVALRTSPLEQDLRPIKPGLSSGHYKALSVEQQNKIHHSVLEVLETVGFVDALPSTIEYMTKAGAFMSPEGRLCIPKSLIEDTIADANRDFLLYGQTHHHDMNPHENRVYFGTAGAGVHMVDYKTRQYRESHLKDLYDMARLVDQLEHIHFFQRTLVPRDLPDPYEMDVNTCYVSVAGTTKHVGSSWVDPTHFDASMEMLHYIAGGEKKWRERPFVSMSSCFVVPPLKFAQDACRCLESAVKAGMPVLLLAAGQAGATSPSSLSGAVVQEVAEVLGGLVYVHTIQKGAPAIFGTWPFVSDLRTGAMSGGSGEQAVLSAACAQMGRFYNLATGVPAGMSDSKLPDMQAGIEAGYNHAIVGHSGANLVYESAGMQASLLGCSFEKLVIDHDSICAVMRSIRGVETDTDSLSVDVIRNVCINGPGHFLGHDQTLERMQRDYVYPLIGDRTSPKEWAENKSSESAERAHDFAHNILQNYFPNHIDKKTDDYIRARLPIKIDRSDMQKSL